MSAVGRAADQALGADLNMALAPSKSRAAATYHVLGTAPFDLAVGAPAAPDFLASPGKYLHLIIDITNVGGAGTLTVTIMGIDPTSGKVYTILASAALAAVATTILRVGPALTAAANLVANDFIPINWQVQAVVGVNAVIFSLGAMFMP